MGLEQWGYAYVSNIFFEIRNHVFTSSLPFQLKMLLYFQRNMYFIQSTLLASLNLNFNRLPHNVWLLNDEKRKPKSLQNYSCHLKLPEDNIPSCSNKLPYTDYTPSVFNLQKKNNRRNGCVSMHNSTCQAAHLHTIEKVEHPSMSFWTKRKVICMMICR